MERFNSRKYKGTYIVDTENPAVALIFYIVDLKRYKNAHNTAYKAYYMLEGSKKSNEGSFSPGYYMVSKNELINNTVGTLEEAKLKVELLGYSRYILVDRINGAECFFSSIKNIKTNISINLK